MNVTRKPLFFFICFCLYYQSTFAENIILVQDKEVSARQQSLIHNFYDEIRELLPEYTVSFMPPVAAGELNGHNNIVLAIGQQALKWVDKGNGNSPVITLFISQSSFAVNKPNSSRITAIYSDPPPDKQIALIKAIFQESASVGIIKSIHSELSVSKAIRTAERLNIETMVVNITKGQTPKEIIDPLKKAKSLLLIKDKDMFEAVSLETLLVLGYDINNLGIIGYSSKVVESGGLATTYTSLSDIAKSTSLLIKKITPNETLPPPQHSKFYHVSINKHVMRSLGLKAINEKEIKERINYLLREQNNND